MSQRQSRRRFLKNASALAVSAYVAGTLSAAQPKRGERVRLGIVGTNGQANYNVGELQNKQNAELCEVVALCDVDENRAGPARERFAKARFYTDYRVMLEKQKDIDAVVVSTPDHHHAFAAIPAM